MHDMARDNAQEFFAEVAKSPPTKEEAIDVLKDAMKKIGCDWRGGGYFLLCNEQELLRVLPTAIAALERE